MFVEESPGTSGDLGTHARKAAARPRESPVRRQGRRGEGRVPHRRGGAPATLRITSEAFADTAPIPARYTADGNGISPPLAIAGVPDGAAALVLFVEDPDAPSTHPFVHLIAWNLRPEDQSFSEGAFTGPAGDGARHDLGRNSFQREGWLPPDPPTGHGPHHYLFQAFALARPAELPAAPGRGALLDALQGNVIARGLLTGTYERT